MTTATSPKSRLEHELLKAQRTCLSKDEAVTYLLELNGMNPPRLQPLREHASDDEIKAYESISLCDLLLASIESTEADYCNAKEEQHPESIIAERRAKLKQCELMYEKAHEYLCLIDDELAKGTLRVDQSATKNPHFPWITIKSFTSWIQDLQQTSPSIPVPLRKKPRTRQLDQENAIKNALIAHGYKDLMNLGPKPARGTAGPLASIREFLLESKSEIFTNNRILELAWGRLLNERKEISYKK